ncbi:hypothetical protein AM571_CH01395 [Rhizobium etli 8C-3]|uniref:Uncharacterized protein n=1 Tax=Rhizobium etli 8C-3 TaxID=538025 RepID=A0A1L5P2A1_RHIET|nr:hypothetical protein AM571_CH01395 [Rhizobium etli 8C-3]
MRKPCQRSGASSEMTAQSFISKLSERESCPACGSSRSEFITVPNGGYVLHQAVLEFECDATFRASSDGISLIYPCPARSVLAADLMTIEVQGRMK